jgi:S-methylmethionine-dependent homocysteine/selenocysteine methylase
MSDMKTPWQQRLDAGDVILLDGGTGSELRRRGAQLDAAAWSGLGALHHPELLRLIHRDYIEAGADVVIANTFAGARFLFDAAHTGHLWRTTNIEAMTIARRARDAFAATSVSVAGSMSNLPPFFDVQRYPPPARERADYVELARLLTDAGAELIALEMIQDVAHGRRALDAAMATGLPVWLGISVRRDQRCGELVGYDRMDQRMHDVLPRLLETEPAVVNVMHSPLDAIEPAIALVQQYWQGPIGVYPECSSRDCSPDALATHARRWIDAGARLIGGCCGTTPAHIAALSSERERWRISRRS